MRRPAILLVTLAAATLALTAGPAAAAPHDFAADARLLYRVVACGGAGAAPAGLDAATVDAHCQKIAMLYPAIE